MSVILFQRVFDVTINHNALDALTCRPEHGTSLYRDHLSPPNQDMRPGCTFTPSLAPASLLMTSGGQDWRPIPTCTLEAPPPVLKSGGYSRQAVGMHPEVLSCSIYKIMKASRYVKLNFLSDDHHKQVRISDILEKGLIVWNSCPDSDNALFSWKLQ